MLEQPTEATPPPQGGDELDSDAVRARFLEMTGLLAASPNDDSKQPESNDSTPEDEAEKTRGPEVTTDGPTSSSPIPPEDAAPALQTGGEGGNDHQPPHRDTSGDIGDEGESQDTPQAVAQRCIFEVEAGITEALTVDPDTVNSNHVGGPHIGQIVLDKIEAAVQANDQPEAKRQLDILFEIPETNKIHWAKGCFLSQAGGDIQAHKTLNVLLAAERTNARRDLEDREMLQLPNYPLVDTKGLEEVVALCRKKNLPPGKWIEDYAYNPEHAWTLHMTQPSPADNPDAKAAELLEEDHFSPTFIFNQTHQALKNTNDPGLRSELVKKFMEPGGMVDLTPETFQSLVKTGQEVLKDPLLADRELVEWFDYAINESAGDLPSNAHAKAALESFEWRVNRFAWGGDPEKLQDLEESQNVSPEDIINKIYEETRELYESLPEVAQSSITPARDELLRDYANRHVTQGNFAAARTFMASITEAIDLEEALAHGLTQATTIEQVALLKPDETILSLHPGMSAYTDLAEARIAGDAEQLEARMISAAQQLKQDSPNCTSNPHSLIKYLENTYATLAEHDESRAVHTARHILDIYRQAAVPLLYQRPLSDALVRSGDPKEPQKAYEAINSQAGWTFGLLNKWWLAKLIKESSGGL